MKTIPPFKDRFKTALELLGLKKQKDVVAALGVSKGYISGLLSGKKMPGDFFRQVIEAKLGISSAWLRDGELPVFTQTPSAMPPMWIPLDMRTGKPIVYDEKTIPPPPLSDREREYVNKLLDIFRHKDEGTISAITQNIDTFLKVPDKAGADKAQKKRKTGNDG